MNLVETARIVLEKAGYATSTATQPDSFYFEDDSLFGMVWAAPSAPEILANWEDRQDSFLRGRDLELRRSGEKSWNAYTVFLTEAAASREDERELSNVEENFRGTRKVACAGVQPTTHAVTKALLPLLPIVNTAQLGETDALARLRKRLSNFPSDKVESILGRGETETILADLLAANEDQ